MLRLREKEISTPIYKLPIWSCLSGAGLMQFEGRLEVSLASGFAFLSFSLKLQITVPPVLMKGSGEHDQRLGEETWNNSAVAKERGRTS